MRFSFPVFKTPNETLYHDKNDFICALQTRKKKSMGTNAPIMCEVLLYMLPNFTTHKLHELSTISSSLEMKKLRFKCHVALPVTEEVVQVTMNLVIKLVLWQLQNAGTVLGT